LDGELTPSKRKRLSELEKQQEIYTRDMEVEIFEKKNSGPNINKMRYTTLRMTRNTRVSVDKKQTRNVRHNRALGKNRGICKDFFLAMRPITCEEWRKAYVVERAIMLIQIPGVMLCSIYIPLVDYEMEKHGWNKLLNCIQVMLNPAMSIIVIKGETGWIFLEQLLQPFCRTPTALISSRGNSLWYVAISQEYIYGVYSLPITMPIAVFMFFQSRTDVPPFYHSVRHGCEILSG